MKIKIFFANKYFKALYFAEEDWEIYEKREFINEMLY